MIPHQPEEVPFVGLVVVGAVLALVAAAFLILLGSFAHTDYRHGKQPTIHNSPNHH